MGERYGNARLVGETLDSLFLALVCFQGVLTD